MVIIGNFGGSKKDQMNHEVKGCNNCPFQFDDYCMHPSRIVPELNRTVEQMHIDWYYPSDCPLIGEDILLTLKTGQ